MNSAILLIIPGFVTDTLGILLLIPFTRDLILKFFIDEKNIKNSQNQNYDTIEVQAEEIDERDRYK